MLKLLFFIQINLIHSFPKWSLFLYLFIYIYFFFLVRLIIRLVHRNGEHITQPELVSNEFFIINFVVPSVHFTFPYAFWHRAYGHVQMQINLPTCKKKYVTINRLYKYAWHVYLSVSMVAKVELLFERMSDSECEEIVFQEGFLLCTFSSPCVTVVAP